MSSRHHKKPVTNSVQDRKYVHSVIEDVEVPQIKEPMPVCSICNEPISAIIEAIREQDGTYSHFDCVISKIKKTYNVQEPDTVSYIGQGQFAVVSKDEDGKLVFKERIPYETIQTFSEMKKFVEESKV